MNQILLIDSPQKIVSLIFLLTNTVVIVIRKVMWILCYVESYFILLATPFIVVRLQCEVVQLSNKNRKRYI